MLVLDPLMDTINYWRNSQNITLLQFLRLFQTTPPPLKPLLHYIVVSTEERKYLLDPDERVACEFEVYGDTIAVSWLRSWADHDRIKQVTQEVREKLEERN